MLHFLHFRLREALPKTQHGFTALDKKELKRLAARAVVEQKQLETFDADLARASATRMMPSRSFDRILPFLNEMTHTLRSSKRNRGETGPFV